MRNNLILLRFGLLTSHDRFGFSGYFGRSEHSIHSHHSRISRSIPLMFALLALAILSGGFLFSHSAYGASYLNVSSSAPEGLVKFSKVQPSSTGSMSTAQDTLTINTNCTVGYSVYVSATSTGDTNLTNSAAANNNTISASNTTVGSTATVLSPDTWGINANSSDVSDGKYYGLPTYASAMNTALTTKSNVEISTTVPIYYGAKVTTAIAPGTYSGDVLYTVLPDSSCLDYIVVFDKNASDATGTMANQSIPRGDATALSANTYTRSGYTFLGWSNSADGKTGTAVNGVGTMADVDYTDKEKVTDLIAGSQTKTLYAIWAVVSGDMQTWTGCPSLATNTVIYLKDTRDNKVYAVKKLPDGKCWMMSNLSVSNVVMTSSDTNLASGATFDLTSGITYSGDSGWCTANSAACDDAKAVYARNDSNGYLYNWYTATAGNGTYSTAADVTINYDICPKGWHLPVGGDNNTSNQFALLDIALGGTGTNRMFANTYSAMTNIFPLVGYIYGSLDYVGRGGQYWSSTAQSNDSAYYLNFYPSDQYMGLRRSSYNFNGNSVRCIAQNNYTVSYNANGGTGAASKASDTIYETGTFTTAGQGTLAKDGYNFLGWSLDQNATSATYAANSSVDVQTLISAAGSPASGSTITLYAVWEEQADGDMQSFNCASLASGATAKLRDTRDGQIYSVYRIPTNATYYGTSTVANIAGKCIMTKDLNLGAVDSVSGASSSITAQGTMNLSPQDSAFSTPTGSGESITVPTTTTAVTHGTPGTGDNYYTNRQYRIDGTGNYAGRGYYTWGAAMLACPKNWRLPTADEYAIGSGWETYTGGLAAIVKGANYSTTISNITSSPWSFVLGGYYNNGFDNAGSYGYYWSTTQNVSTYSYNLYMGSSGGLVRGSGSKRSGYAVRCIADPTMQNFDSSSLPNVGDSTTLVDTRDGTEYVVKRLPDQKVWMVENLKLSNYNLTSSDSNVSSSGFNMLTSNVAQSTGTWCTDWNSTCYNKISVYPRTDSNGNLYNWYTATAGTSGSSYDICPKGWRLPTGGSSGEFAALDKAWGGTGAYRNNANTYSTFTGAYTSGNNGGFTPLPGYINGSLRSVGSSGYWWSSTANGSGVAHYLNLYSSNSNVDPDSYFYSNCAGYHGYSVRCVAKS
ncbi:InlB B-repeat-containing protein [Candidatus Saccharibacteria bacterium]|nr:InlB B-repeat-containing protein [Candidatus Saccharibacteria bacterium]